MENKKTLGIIDQFLIATTKWKSYVSLTEQKGRTVVKYFLLITLLITTITSVIPVAGYVTSIGGFQKFFSETLPEFEYKDGILDIDRRVTMDFLGMPITIDSTIEEYSAGDFDNTFPQQLLIGKNQLFIYQSGQVFTAKLGTLYGRHINNQTLANHSSFFNFLMFVYVFFGFLFELCSYLIGAFFYAILGVNISAQRKIKLSFSQIFKIAIYAKTCAAILDAVYSVIGNGIFGLSWIFISMIITFVFLSFGIIAHRSDKQDSDAKDLLT